MIIRVEKETTTPWIIVFAFVGRVNEKPFMYQPKKYWLCVSCNCRILSDLKVEMVFEMIYNPNYYSEIDVYPACDFNKLYETKEECQHNFSYRYKYTKKCIYCGENKSKGFIKWINKIFRRNKQ